MNYINYFFRLSLLLLITNPLPGQVIKGEVRAYETDEPVPFAHVYFNSSMRGTTTDENGYFVLSTKDFEAQHVVVSCVGFDSWILKEWQEGKYYRIYLKPSSNVLTELYITSKDIPRERKERMFLREFLGTTKNGLSCTIENLDEVMLVYFRDSRTLKAFCDNPLIIRNKSLGYKIRYYLDNFELDQEHMFYRGYYMFEDDTTLTRHELASAQKRREKAYDGSRMHFFRELWRKSTYKLEFQIQYANTEEVVDLDSLVGDIHNHVRLLKSCGDLDIYYKQHVSRVTFVDKEDVPFARTGFFDSEHMRWSGKMAVKRVGDLLPFEYWP